MRRTFITLFILSLLLAACAPQSATPQTKRSLELTDCVLPTNSSQQIDAQCGTLNVPEEPDNPGGRQIPLKIAVIPAIKRNPAPDPLFMLAGGPGQSAIETYPVIVNLLYNIHEKRDIVLVDQRGTGESNPLRCLTEKDESLTSEQANARLETCPTTLQADPRFYTTEIAMRDLDAVRAALGYETINLYGASYGTRAALTYLRLFPERVRTMTLDAVVDPGFVLFLDAAHDGQQALEAFFARCAADETCSTNFPNLRAEFDGILSRLEASPAKVSLPHPRTNLPLELTVTREMVANLVFSTLYSPDLAATLPLSIHTAYADENYAPLISQAYLLDAGLYDGMFYAVACTEDAPLISAAEAGKRSQGSVFGDKTADFVEICAKWPKGTVSAEFRSPVVSNVPALILSGSADPITPPVHAEKVAEAFSNELHLVFKGMGHGNLSSRCSVNLLTDFIESASTAGLDTSCVEAVEPPPFFVDFSGPKP